MWVRFGEEARHAVFCAQEQAVLLSSATVEPEHFLLAFAELPTCAASRMLEAAPVDLNAMRETLMAAPPYPRPHFQGGGNSLGAAAKTLVDLAYIVAKTRKDDVIGTEHLLYAIVKQGSGPAAEFLIESGANLARIQEVWPTFP